MLICLARPYDPSVRTVIGRGSCRILVVVSVTALACTLLGGCGASRSSSSGASGNYPSYSYTCCPANLSATLWHPGQTLRVTWSAVRETQSPAGSQAGITLTMVLTGPYGNVSTLKSAIAARPSPTRPGGRAPMAVAPAIRTTTRAGGAPVSVLVIPRDTPPGFYNLQFGAESGSARSGGSTIIRVAP